MAFMSDHAWDRLMSLPCERVAKALALRAAEALEEEAAVCVAVRPTIDGRRDQWGASDVLCVVVRASDSFAGKYAIVSSFLTRKSQANLSHLRVQRIVWA
jgi:hypothetical protein